MADRFPFVAKHRRVIGVEVGKTYWYGELRRIYRMYIPLLLTTTYTLIAVERESVGCTVQCTEEEMYFWRALFSTGTRKCT